MTRVVLGTLAASALLLAGCTSSTSPAGDGGSAPSSDGGPVSVVAAFYPLAYAAQSVGADAVDVTSLTPPGLEPHDLELSAQQVAEIASADLVLYVKGFQPAVDEAVQQQAADRAIDVSAGLVTRSGDPHVWLDPANMSSIGSAIAEKVAAAAPDRAASVESATADFTAQMADLDSAFTSGLATCTSRDLVVSHEAFGYLADAYDLNQIGISGLSPDAEPSPARIREVADMVTSSGVSTVYYETLVDPKVAQTIADETGATTAVLDPLEGLAEGATGDYASIMRQNLQTLRAGQGCT